MIRHLECWNDEAVVRALGIPKKAIRHQSGSGAVAEALRKSSVPCLGMVDEDPRGTVPRYFGSFVVEDKGDGLILKIHPKAKHRLIVVMPDLEPWLLAVSQSVNVPPGDFKLPPDAKTLHQIGHAQRFRFAEWIERMLERGAPGLRRLQTWLR